MTTLLTSLKRHYVLVIIALLSIFPFIKHASVFTTPNDMEEYGRKYSQSQYVLGNASPEKVSDSELYVYAGFAYWKGEDPTTINFEHPPLAKYLYGIAYLLFKNAYVLNILLYPVLLYAFHLFSKTVLKSTISRAAALIIFGTQAILFELVQYVLLDIPLLILTLSLFVLLYKEFDNKVKKYLLAGALLGLIASIKYPVPFILVPSFLILAVAFYKKEVRSAIVAFPVSIAIYLAQYVMYFSNGHNLIDFARFEAYRFNWWVGDRSAPKFLVFPNLFFGKYKAWWLENEYHYTKEWTVFLPILFILHIITSFLQKKSFWIWTLILYSAGLLFVFGYGSAAELRYLLQIIPIWIVLILRYIEMRYTKS